MDPRDPRSKGWPCKDKRNPGPVQNNQYGCWVKCEKCALRLAYKSKKGNVGKHRSCEPIPELVTQAIEELIVQGVTSSTMNKNKMIGKIEELTGKAKQERPVTVPGKKKGPKGRGKGASSKGSNSSASESSWSQVNEETVPQNWDQMPTNWWERGLPTDRREEWTHPPVAREDAVGPGATDPEEDLDSFERDLLHNPVGGHEEVYNDTYQEDLDPNEQEEYQKFMARLWAVRQAKSKAKSRARPSAKPAPGQRARSSTVDPLNEDDPELMSVAGEEWYEKEPEDGTEDV